MITNFNPFGTYPFGQTPFYGFGSQGFSPFHPGSTFGQYNWNNSQVPFNASFPVTPWNNNTLWNTTSPWSTNTPWNTSNFNPFISSFAGYNTPFNTGFNTFQNGYNVPFSAGFNTFQNGWNPYSAGTQTNTLGTNWHSQNPYNVFGSWNAINPFVGLNNVPAPFGTSVPWTNYTGMNGVQPINGFVQPFGFAYPYGLTPPFIGSNIWNGQFPYVSQNGSQVTVPGTTQAQSGSTTTNQQIEMNGRIAAYPIPFGGFAPFMCVSPQPGVSNCAPVTQAA